jgi:FlaA1/EpsC-like NDP-sugar epimerase
MKIKGTNAVSKWRLLSLLLISSVCTNVIALASPTNSLTKPRTVLVTGGAGYIGSHTCLELLEAMNYNVVVVDNLDNSSEESLRRVQALTNCDPDRLQFRNCDIRDKDGLEKGTMKHIYRQASISLDTMYV